MHCGYGEIDETGEHVGEQEGTQRGPICRLKQRRHDARAPQADQQAAEQRKQDLREHPQCIGQVAQPPRGRLDKRVSGKGQSPQADVEGRKPPQGCLPRLERTARTEEVSKRTSHECDTQKTRQGSEALFVGRDE